mmetsp:Transcript_276/g.367  ORF Transcript_276/g.367 Transcript_276/m.367 type:complete len:165 (-) Transcript_276:270-764(-)
MKSYAVLILSIIFNTSNSFTIRPSSLPQLAATSRDSLRRPKPALYLSTTEMNTGKNNSLANDLNVELSQEESWQVYLQSSEVQEVREQLIEKYLSLGRSQEYAEVEIDKFLNDPERSRKFLEMRKYVKSQKDASMGFENFFLYGSAFFFGLLGDMIFKYIQSIQ